MTDALSSLLRWLDLSGAAIALGAWLLAAWARRRPMDGTAAPESARRLASPLPDVALVIAIVTAALGQAVNAAQAAGIAPLALDANTWRDYTFDTHAGRVHAVRWGLLIAAGLLAWVVAHGVSDHSRRPRLQWAPVAVLALAQACTALAGHAYGADAPLFGVVLQMVHVLAASVWLGGLCLIAWVAFRSAQAPNLLRTFSPIALLAMALIVATGAWQAIDRVDRWPPLFGTPYGQWLLLKMAGLFVALGCAAVLRWHWLPRLGETSTAMPSTPWRWLLVEGVMGLAIWACAGRLATITPARHDAIDWPFAFRLAWQVNWALPGVAQATLTGLGMALVGGVIGLVLWARRRPWSGALVAICTCAVGAWVGLPPLAVEAHADTYRTSSVAYDAVSIANGHRLFQAHCVGCHGRDADGRGPLSGGLPKPAADLTAAHAGDHTAGDLFGWLTQGMRGRAMPGFADRLTVDDRWDLVNYLHTLASGYQARVIRPHIASHNPWLAAPPFAYETADGERGSLRDLRERRAVLLVFDGGATSLPRLQRLAALQPSLEAAGVTVLRMPMAETMVANEPDEWRALRRLRSDPAVVLAYQQFRRTLQHLRAGESGPMPAHMEFLIDRYGYLRARWLPEDEQPGWDDAAQLLAQARALAAEPRVRPPPDDHLH